MLAVRQGANDGEQVHGSRVGAHHDGLHKCCTVFSVSTNISDVTKERCKLEIGRRRSTIYLAFSRTVRCSWSGVKAHSSFSIDKALLCRSLSLNFTAGSDHWFCCCCCCCCCCDVIERSVAMAGDEHCSDDVAPGACKNGERGSIKIRVTGNCHLSNRPCKFSLICTLKTNV